jgi:hypothetical protein
VSTCCCPVLSHNQVTIAYPDEGAWKRFHYQFKDEGYPEVICTKVRDGAKRIVRLKVRGTEGTLDMGVEREWGWDRERARQVDSRSVECGRVAAFALPSAGAAAYCTPSGPGEVAAHLRALWVLCMCCCCCCYAGG